MTDDKQQWPELDAIDVGELLSKGPPPPHGAGKDWGDWRREGLELVFPAYPGGGVYPIDLERFVDSAHVLDTVMQIAGKSWATDVCLAGLVRALDALLHPQATLCSCGQNKKLTPAQIRKRLKEHVR